jgi:hypothetical protein
MGTRRLVSTVPVGLVGIHGLPLLLRVAATVAGIRWFLGNEIVARITVGR